MAKPTIWSRYTEEEIKEIFESSTSYREAMMKLGYAVSGSAHETMKGLVKRFDLDVSHFTGKSQQKPTVPIERYLNNEAKINSSRLRPRLIKEGYFEHKCNRCGLTEWMGEPIPLELHHKDGDNLNNNLDNLEIICPNCHTFTDGYRNRTKI